MMATVPRLPRQITLPFGYKIRVLYRTPAQLNAAGLPDCHGAWVATTRTLYINRTDHVAEQMLSLAHELQHACVDYLHWLDQWRVQPLCAESAETARELEEE